MSNHLVQNPCVRPYHYLTGVISAAERPSNILRIKSFHLFLLKLKLKYLTVHLSKKMAPGINFL